MLSDLYAERDRTLAQLAALKTFPNTRTVRQLRRELQEKLKRLEEKIEQLEREEEEDESSEDDEQEDNIVANARRSKGLKKYHRYIRLIHDNYPEYSYKQIRSMLAKRKRGKEVDIPDVVWQNPSP